MTDTAYKPEPRPEPDPSDGWRRFKPLRWRIAAGVVVVLLGLALTGHLHLPDYLIPWFLRPALHPETADYTDVATGVALAGAFLSYQSVDAAVAVLDRAGFKDRTRLSRRAAPSPSYPPYRIDALEIAEYRHLESKGHLTLRFFNDRLFQAEFIPADPPGYARRLRNLGMHRDRNARMEKIEGDLRVASTVELAISSVGQSLRTEPFVLWQDLRLVGERDQWETKFGAIPKAFAQD